MFTTVVVTCFYRDRSRINTAEAEAAVSAGTLPVLVIGSSDDDDHATARGNSISPQHFADHRAAHDIGHPSDRHILGHRRTVLRQCPHGAPLGQGRLVDRLQAVGTNQQTTERESSRSIRNLGLTTVVYQRCDKYGSTTDRIAGFVAHNAGKASFRLHEDIELQLLTMEDNSGGQATDLVGSRVDYLDLEGSGRIVVLQDILKAITAVTAARFLGKECIAWFRDSGKRIGIPDELIEPNSGIGHRFAAGRAHRAGHHRRGACSGDPDRQGFSLGHPFP